MSSSSARGITEATDSMRLHLVAYPERSSSLIQMHLDDIDSHADAMGTQIEMLQRACWALLKVNADVTTKRESDPDYYRHVEEMYAAVAACEAAGYLPPKSLPDDPVAAKLERWGGGLSGKQLREEMVLILRAAGEPLHYTEILRRLQSEGIRMPGREPARNVGAHLANDPRCKAVGAGRWVLA